MKPPKIPKPRIIRSEKMEINWPTALVLIVALICITLIHEFDNSYLKFVKQLPLFLVPVSIFRYVRRFLWKPSSNMIE